MNGPILCFMGVNRFLSNFWPCNIVFEGESYRSVEAAYVASKTTDPEIRAQVRRLQTSGDCKKYGKMIKLRPDFENIKMDVMKYLVSYKFSSKNPELMQRLIDTGDRELIEGNDWGDVYWGVCNGVGENRLGRILMDVREELKAFEI